MLILCMVVGNMINFMVIVCVWKVFLVYLLFGKCMVWDKIMYDFFDVVQLVQICKQFGELLIIWQVVELEWLQQVLVQQYVGWWQLLGCILLIQGWLDDEILVEVIVFQGDLLCVVIDVDYLCVGLFLVSVDVCVQWCMLLLLSWQQEILWLVVVSLLFEDVLVLLKQEIYSVYIEQSIVCESEINVGLCLIGGDQYWQLDDVFLLGDLLVEMCLIDYVCFEIVLDVYKLQCDGCIGDYLVKQGIIIEEVVVQVMQEQCWCVVVLQLLFFGVLLV